MNPSTIDDKKIVAALLTVALASSKSGFTPMDILASYRKFLSELSPKPQGISPVQEPRGRKFMPTDD
jgi:hypothetical protein